MRDDSMNLEAQLQLYLEGRLNENEEHAFIGWVRSDCALLQEVRARIALIYSVWACQVQNVELLKQAQAVDKDHLKGLLAELDQNDRDEVLIEHFLQGKLIPDEQLLYEQRKEDRAFQQVARRMTAMKQAISQVQAQNDEVLNAARSVSKQDLLNALNEQAAPSNVVQMTPRCGYRRWISIAAAVVLVGGLSVDYYFASETRGLATESLQQVGVSLNEMGASRSGEQFDEQLFALVKDLDRPVRMDAAVKELERLYRKVTDELADPEDVYIEPIALTLSAGYIRQGERAKAKQVLKVLVDDPLTSQQTRSIAERMLSSLSKTFLF